MRCKGSYAQSKSLKVVNKQHPKINQPKSFPKPCPNELHCQQINCYCTLWQECSQKDTIEKVSSKTQKSFCYLSLFCDLYISSSLGSCRHSLVP